VKTHPVVAAQPSRNDEGLPFNTLYGDLYHPRSGAQAQAQAVFLVGNGLPGRWAGRHRFVVLETGFGLGNNFLATWQAWRQDPQRCARLHFISIEKHPLERAQLAEWQRGAPWADLSACLLDAWPPLTHNLHRLSFEGGAVQLLLCFGDVADWLPELDAQVDAFYLDGFAPVRNPQMWQPRLYKACARLAAPGATVATWSAARALREGLTAAGFEVHKGAGTGGKRDITLARYAPRFVPHPTPSRRAAASASASASTTAPGSDRHALIIGGGLAGCAAAWALAEQGWRSTVLDRHDAPAQEASGNPAGLFHGIVNAQDGAHARFNRIAALEARAAVAQAIEHHRVPGAVTGLLRLHMDAGGAPAMRALLRAAGLPADYVQAFDADAASLRAGIPLRHPAWWYPGGGWVDPGGLARSFLERPGSSVQFRGGLTVARIQRSGDGWQALAADDTVLASARSLVLASAGDALRLLGAPPWPIESQRGQITTLPAADWRAAGLPIPTCALAGAGYLLPEVGHQMLFGATSHAGDGDALVRPADHEQNMAQLQRLLGRPLALTLAQASGRVGWRCTSGDRLPVIGPVPDEAAMLEGKGNSAPRWDQARFVPRIPGLFVFTALGSRGITWAALGAQVLAACVSGVTGAPVPLESSLLDAVDPARFVVRRRRRSNG
jgi:tRNA 5-methylaminomethyl-2-thiouridine biosynthesis bifunctional protein